MKASFIVPCRDKAKHCAAAVKSVLAQSYSNTEILLSDQGSTDGTREIVHDIARTYNGPHDVKLLDCPDTSCRGMAGLNAHLNWLAQQATGDIVLIGSADDLNHPDRVSEVVKAFGDHPEAVYVSTGTEFIDPANYETTGYTLWTGPDDGGWVSMEDHLERMLGGSSAPSMRRDFMLKYPLELVETQDMVHPFFSLLDGKWWFVNKPLYGFIKHADGGNAGLEGVQRAAKTDDEKLQAAELVAFHMTFHYTQLLGRAQREGKLIAGEDLNLLATKIVQAAHNWSQTRATLTLMRTEPMGMKI